MSFFENAILSLIRKKLSKALNLNDIKEITAEGIKAHRDIPYSNQKYMTEKKCRLS